MTLDEAILADAKQARDRLVELQHEVESARSDYHHAIRRLHAAGGSMREIAEELGLSHQRIHQIVDELSGPVPPMRRVVRRKHLRGPFQRFTSRARDVVAHAQREAKELGHDAVGTEHLLLGLLAAEGAAAKALAAAGIEADAVRALAGTGDAEPGRPGFSRHAKRALEAALREAIARGDRHIGDEHILLALAREEDGILSRLGVDPDELERALAA